MPSSRTRPRAARCGLVAVALLLSLSSGCAYFNTFYNAKHSFGKAEEERKGQIGAKGVDSYQKCIDKCLQLLKYYPSSKYVDDALFLIGMSRYYRGEYVQSQASFDDLLTRFPNTEFAERALFYTGMGSLQEGDPAGASRAFEVLAQRFPNSDLVVEAVFRIAEADLDRHAYETARDELRAFVQKHPESRLVPEAQLRLARTYYEEKRYSEALQEYMRVLQQKITPEVRFEAQLNSALALRGQAEEILADPALSRDLAERGAAAARNAGSRRHKAPPAPARSIEPGSAEFDTTGAGEPEQTPVEVEPESGTPPEEAQVPPGESETPHEDTETIAGLAPAIADSSAAADTTAARGSSAAAADGDPDAKAAPLTPEQLEQRRQADDLLSQAAERLAALRKPSAKLGRGTELQVELAVTRSLSGEPDAAIDDLDQLARSKPRTELAARAQFEIGEIHRRAGRMDKAREAYDQAVKAKQDAPVAEAAKKKSAAILARMASQDRLKGAPEVLREWRQQPEPAPAESLEAFVALQSKFEALASDALHVAEIDLLELDQPLLALRELERLLRDYPGSMQSPRAAFAVAWIYEQRLHDPARARQAYESVARDYPDTPQGREARAILEGKPSRTEVIEPSSQP